MQVSHVLVSMMALALSGCSFATRIDYSHLFSRAGWQHPNRVIESLDLQPGDRVADIGAGDGYFTFRLAEAVGPTGRVYGVEIDTEKVHRLQDAAQEHDDSNVTVILGKVDDPLLPDGEIDLVFLCNTYHHLADRVPYFTRLHSDLAPGARVAIIDARPEGFAALLLFLHRVNWLEPGIMAVELEEAGYRHTAEYAFLPLQSFEIFAAESLPESRQTSEPASSP